ncbi:uncharacterized protein UDID_11119 [Ustilago sp. UG-2017a]|nr:uncharacterized protein UDID_11119 [Ustilago sp. UG-2017a]
MKPAVVTAANTSLTHDRRIPAFGDDDAARSGCFYSQMIANCASASLTHDQMLCRPGTSCAARQSSPCLQIALAPDSDVSKGMSDMPRFYGVTPNTEAQCRSLKPNEKNAVQTKARRLAVYGIRRTHGRFMPFLQITTTRLRCGIRVDVADGMSTLFLALSKQVSLSIFVLPFSESGVYAYSILDDMGENTPDST